MMLRLIVILLFLFSLFNCAGDREIKDVWTPQSSGKTASFRGLSAVSETTAWASGGSGTVLRTTNGGETWDTIVVPDASALDFRDIEAFDESTAYIVTAGAPAKIFKTTNGGGSWIEQYYNTDPQVFFDSMAFWDENTGIAFSDPVNGTFFLIKTTNGGESWNPVPPVNIPPALDGEAGFAASGTCVAVYGDKHVWFCTGGMAARIFRSDDQGITWKVSDTPVLSGESSTGNFSIAFKNEYNGIIVGGDYRNDHNKEANAAITTDGGVTWTLVKAGSRPAGFRSCVAYVPESNGSALVAVGTSGSDISLDGGYTWTNVDTTGYHTISFGDTQNSGWAAGGRGRIAKFGGIQAAKDAVKY